MSAAYPTRGNRAPGWRLCRTGGAWPRGLWQGRRMKSLEVSVGVVVVLLWGAVLLAAAAPGRLAAAPSGARGPGLCDPAPALELRVLSDATGAGTALAPPSASSAPPSRGSLSPASLSLASLRGQVVIVDFFATWCGPCHQALADLGRMMEEARQGTALAAGPAPAKVALVVVAVGESAQTVSRFFALHPELRLPQAGVVVLDPEGATARRFGQTRFPTTFLIDPEGRVRHINRGYGPGYFARLRRWLQPMRAATGAPCVPPA